MTDDVELYISDIYICYIYYITNIYKSYIYLIYIYLLYIFDIFPVLINRASNYKYSERIIILKSSLRRQAKAEHEFSVWCLLMSDTVPLFGNWSVVRYWSSIYHFRLKDKCFFLCSFSREFSLSAHTKSIQQ